MKEHKSTLRALEPVEIRLASAVRVRREIERLRTIEQALDADAYAIANEVLGGKAPVVQVFLEALKEPLETDPNDFDQDAVAAFLASEHALHLDGVVPAAAEAAPSVPTAAPAAPVPTPPQSSETQPTVAPAEPAAATQPAADGGRTIVPPSDEAPKAEVATRSVAVDPVPSPLQAGLDASAGAAPHLPAPVAVPAAEVAGRSPPADPAPASPDASPGPSAAFLAIRLADYDIVMPNDYFGVVFDMTKRAEADAILCEAALAVADQIPLDASPYKGDRGKVHWRRRLFEEAYAYFLSSPPRPIEGEPGASALPEQLHQKPPAVADDRVSDLLVSPTSEIRLVHEEGQPSQVVEPETSGQSDQDVMEVDADHASARRAAAPAAPEEDAGPELPVGNREGGSEDAPAAPPPTTSEVPPTTGQVIGFPGMHAAARPAASLAVDDIVDVFEDKGAAPSGQGLFEERSAAATASSEQSGYEGPSYDGPDWEAPIDELEGRFADAMADEGRGSDDDGQGSDDEPRFDHAAAAALAAAVPPPAPAQTVPAAVLPSGGVPPRPPALVSSVRSAPALPPRPSVAPAPAASPVPVQASVVSATPAAASVAGRVAPRAVSVRPPGL